MEVKRVKYLNSPLAEVIFQVRFPNILRIAAEEPSSFQDAIRAEFPLFSVNNNETIVEINGQRQSVGKTKNYQFISTDSLSKVNLTNSFIAFSTLEYDRWEVFKAVCEKVYNIFDDIYKPSVVSRIGLRYKDVIMRSKWGLQGTSWKDLIKTEHLGILADIDESKTKRYVVDYEFEDCAPIIAHRHFELIRTSQNMSELSLLIDCDYSVNSILKSNSVFSFAEQLHDSSSRFLRTAITEKLHMAMEPEAL